MAVTGLLDKIVWGGGLCGTESWSCSVHIVHPSPEDAPTVLPALKTAITTWFQSAGLHVNAGATFTYVKINRIDPATGRYVDQTNSNTLAFNPVLPPSGSFAAAPQLSAAVSLGTASSRGLASKGRFYPPSPGGDPGVTGHLNSADVTNYLNDNAALIRAFNAAVPGGVVSVFSATGQVAQPVTTVRVGDVTDTQRRRRKSLVEKYTSTAV
jgi:hypothetical protein